MWTKCIVELPNAMSSPVGCALSAVALLPVQLDDTLRASGALDTLKYTSPQSPTSSKV